MLVLRQKDFGTGPNLLADVLNVSRIYTPGTESVTAEWGVSKVAATLGLSLFAVGYSVAPMVWATLSEVTWIGRTPVFTLAIFVALQVPSALCDSFRALLVLRFLAGVFGSSVFALGGATISDMFQPQKRGHAMGAYYLSVYCGMAIENPLSHTQVQVSGPS